jgi:hypothetical protein
MQEPGYGVFCSLLPASPPSMPGGLFLAARRCRGRRSVTGRSGFARFFECPSARNLSGSPSLAWRSSSRSLVTAAWTKHRASSSSSASRSGGVLGELGSVSALLLIAADPSCKRQKDWKVFNVVTAAALLLDEGRCTDPTSESSDKSARRRMRPRLTVSG